MPIPDSVPVMKMLTGPNLKGVPAVQDGVDDLVIVAGAGKHVVAYNVQKEVWTM